MARHESGYEKAGTILDTELSQQDRNRFFAELRMKNDRIVGILELAAQQEILGWSSAAPSRFERPQLHMRGRAQLLSSIRNYAL